MKAKQLDIDLASGNLPQYSNYLPNIEKDGHNTGLTYTNHFLGSFFAERLAKFPKGK
jgi:hypothetical protein